MEGAVLLLWLAIGSIPAFIAKGKGRSFGLWFLFGLVCFLIALIASLVIEAQRPCHQCGALARESASFCPSCGTQFAAARAYNIGSGGPYESMGGSPLFPRNDGRRN